MLDINDSKNYPYRDSLVNQGYSPTQTNRVLARRDFNSIAYSDGSEVEENLLQTLRNSLDVSIFSQELASACVDWPSTYHFSSSRANLLRPFADSLKGNVLELGAGCGGVTRFLGETAKEVIAVEGTLARCEINAERVRDLNNVCIVASELSEFETSLKFDVVVVVGVLEYSALFIDSDEPHLAFLKRAREFLKPGGTLLLAIENKLGLKYFAGSLEDHTSEKNFGIENRYSKNGVRTFSKKELLELTIKAGFKTTFVHSPVPDYKLPQLLVSQQGFEDERFSEGDLFAQQVYSDPQVPVETNFDLPLAWRNVSGAGLTQELANSFLIECKITSGQSALDGHLAYIYGPPKKPQFFGEKTFLAETSQRSIRVAKQEGFEQRGPNLFRYSPDSVEHYFRGESASTEFGKILSSQKWTLGDLELAVRGYLKHVEIWAKSRNVIWPTQVSETLPSDFLDLVPRNAILHKERGLQVFDLEWAYEEQIPLGYLIFRIVTVTLSETPYRKSPAGWERATLDQVLEEIFKRFGISKTDYSSYKLLEMELRNSVNQVEMTKAEYLAQFQHKFGAYSERDSLLGEHDSLLGERDSLLGERDSLLGERDSLLGERDSILNSYSWRMTAAVRKIGKFMI